MRLYYHRAASIAKLQMRLFGNCKFFALPYNLQVIECRLYVFHFRRTVVKAVRSMPDKMSREPNLSPARRGPWRVSQLLQEEFGKARDRGTSRREEKRLGAAAKQNEKTKKSQKQLPPCPDCSKVFANKDSRKKHYRTVHQKDCRTRDRGSTRHPQEPEGLRGMSPTSSWQRTSPGTARRARQPSEPRSRESRSSKSSRRKSRRAAMRGSQQGKAQSWPESKSDPPLNWSTRRRDDFASGRSCTSTGRARSSLKRASGATAGISKA